MSVISRLIAPGPRGRLRWTVVGMFLVFLIAFIYSGSEFYNGSRNNVNNWLHSQAVTKSITLSEIKFGSWPPSTFRLGLDLRGGTHLVYDADMSRTAVGDRDKAVEGVRDVIERRVNAFGVSEPLVQTVNTGDTYRCCRYWLSYRCFMGEPDFGYFRMPCSFLYQLC